MPTAYGRAASAALHDAVRAAKRDEALAPVTVVVPTNSVGVAARRRLASGELGPLASAGRGIAGVTFLTVYRLAELLAAPSLAAARRRPVSTPVVASAVRGVLARAPGVFVSVAAHPATEEALVAAHRELADLDEAQLDLLAQQHPRAREVVRVHRATRGVLRDDVVRRTRPHARRDATRLRRHRTRCATSARSCASCRSAGRRPPPSSSARSPQRLGGGRHRRADRLADRRRGGRSRAWPGSARS